MWWPFVDGDVSAIILYSTPDCRYGSQGFQHGMRTGRECCVILYESQDRERKVSQRKIFLVVKYVTFFLMIMISD